MPESFTRSYRSFSGVDIQAVFDGKIIGTLQGISFTVTREKAPQYTMGQVDPRSFSRGKRGIAGSMIFLIFDQSNLIRALDRKFWADKNDFRRLGSDVNSAAGNIGDRFAAILPPGGSGDTERLEQFKRAVDLEPALPWYHDQLPPFDVVLTAATEYGQVSRMAIHGVEIMNAGSGISIDDITTDENMTFV